MPIVIIFLSILFLLFSFISIDYGLKKFFGLLCLSIFFFLIPFYETDEIPIIINETYYIFSNIEGEITEQIYLVNKKITHYNNWWAWCCLCEDSEVVSFELVERENLLTK